jgi:iron complex outermembrane receptor protein
MKSMVLGLSLAIGALMLQAQPTGVIVGKVVEKESQKPLSGAHAVLTGSTIGSMSDERGEFQLKGLLPGDYELRVSYVGYVTRTRQVRVLAGEATMVAIELQTAILPGQQITVTATRGRDRETPATFSTLERQDIRERYTTQDLPVLLSELPSSTYYSESGNGIGYTYLTIRGFDSRRVAVLVNGIPQNDPEDHNVYWLDFPDLTASVEDVQVQRGAGSAFYGPPAIGGSVNLVTTLFARERSAQFSAGYGSFNTRKYSASVYSGLIDERYAIHARLSKILSSGYREKSWVDFSSYFLGLIRYDDAMTTQINFYGGPIADGLAYYGIPKADVTDRARRRMNPISRPEEIENFFQPHYELFHEWRLGPSLTLNNAFFLLFGEGFFDYDGSWAPLSYYRITSEYGFPVSGDPDTLYLPGALIRAEVANRQYGWLPRLTWKHDGGEMIVGGELRIHQSDHWGRLQWSEEIPHGVPFDYRYYEYKGAKDIVSLYVHELFQLRQDLQLMADLQYAYNRYRLYDEKFIGTDFAVPYHFVNPRLGLNYNINDRWNAYVSVAYTSREPRLKNLYDAGEASTPGSWGRVVPQFEPAGGGTYDFSRPLVKPEALFDLELGGAVSSDVLHAAGNFYWMEFSDEIIKSGQVDRFGQPITGNADRTRHIGLELSARLRTEGGFEFIGNATAGRNRFVRHTDFSTGVPIVLNGKPIAGFPDFLANVRSTFRTGPFSASLGARFVGRQYTDNFQNDENTVDPHVVSDGWVSYQLNGLPGDVKVEAKLQVNNIFDALYAAYGEGSQFFVGAERNLFFNVTIIL